MANVTDITSDYLGLLNKYEVLSKKEESALLKKYRSSQRLPRTAENAVAIKAGMGARNKLIRHNLRLVVSMAKKLHAGVEMLAFDDLIAYGNQGLIKAIDHKVDLSKGCISTGSYYWIRQAIMNAIYWNSRTVRIPVYLWRSRNAIRRASAQLTAELGREPTIAEICKRANVSAAKYHRIDNAFQPAAPFSSATRDKAQDAQLAELEDQDAVDPKYRLLYKLLQDLKDKDPNLVFILKHTFGLNVTPLSDRDIAERLGIKPRQVSIKRRKGLQSLKLEISRDDNQWIMQA